MPGLCEGAAEDAHAHTPTRFAPHFARSLAPRSVSPLLSRLALLRAVNRSATVRVLVGPLESGAAVRVQDTLVLVDFKCQCTNRSLCSAV